jgi:hypothetical protein
VKNIQKRRKFAARFASHRARAFEYGANRTTLLSLSLGKKKHARRYHHHRYFFFDASRKSDEDDDDDCVVVW